MLVLKMLFSLFIADFDCRKVLLLFFPEIFWISPNWVFTTHTEDLRFNHINLFHKPIAKLF
jgi:hypothetical protein